MKGGDKIRSLLPLPIFCVFLFPGLLAKALPYDYSASIECLENPHKPQYNGGIIVNPELNDGLKAWSIFGDAKIEHRESNGNKFIVAHSRRNPHGSMSQKLYLKKNRLYTFSAWIQVSQGNNALVKAIFKTASGFKLAGTILAESKCWSMLKGGLTVDTSGPTELYFESKNPSAEIWVDSVSLQPFTEKEWRSHQDQITEKIRKEKVRIQAVDKQGNPTPNATISVEQKRLGFPFGCAINKNILSDTAYQNWFTSRFTVTTFVNEMKWYSTECCSWGNVDYSVPDAMVNFAEQHNIAVRGHNVFWDDPNYQPGWVKSLSPNDLRKATDERIESIMTRYEGRLISWDVVNENLHFNFFESKLGLNASSVFYNMAGKIDGSTTLFLNEFNTIEESRDGISSPANYLQKLREIKEFPGNGNLSMGIGLQSHFGTPNLPYMRASLDTLAAANLPIWLTEVDVKRSPNQAQYLEQILREAHSYPKIGGIIIWSPPQGCDEMCLTDNNFKNLATGDVVDKLLHEWRSSTPFVAMTDSNGFFEASLFHGDYNVMISHNGMANPSATSKIKVAQTDGSGTTLLQQVIA